MSLCQIKKQALTPATTNKAPWPGLVIDAIDDAFVAEAEGEAADALLLGNMVVAATTEGTTEGTTDELLLIVL